MNTQRDDHSRLPERSDGLEPSLEAPDAALQAAEIARLQQLLAARDAHIAALYHSTSWRLTRPLRMLSTLWIRSRQTAVRLRLALRWQAGPTGVLPRAWKYYRRGGMAGLRAGYAAWRQPVAAHGAALLDPRHDYAAWLRQYALISAPQRETWRANIDAFAQRPLISVLMPTYNSQLEFLDQAIWSVRRQVYPHWELCIADDASSIPAVQALLARHGAEDARIRIVYRSENGHISASSNSALALVQGAFVALFDHDDLLAEHALYCIAQAINACPDAGLIYSDEDKVDAANRHYDPYFKSDMNEELLLAHNLVCHLGVYRTDLVRAAGGFRLGFEGAQDYDLALRVLEKLVPRQVTTGAPLPAALRLRRRKRTTPPQRVAAPSLSIWRGVVSPPRYCRHLSRPRLTGCALPG
jgi:hypothetical protein